MARRLAEAEVPLITVFWNHSGRGQDTRPGQIDSYGWDTHNDIFSVYRDHLLPRFDQSLSALLRDLEERGPARSDPRRLHGRIRPRPAGSPSKPDSTAPRPAASTGPACTPSSWPAPA